MQVGFRVGGKKRRSGKGQGIEGVRRDVESGVEK